MTHRRRPLLTDAVEWIAMNDEPGDLDPKSVAGYISTALIADLFGTPADMLARRIVLIRQRLEREAGR